MSGLIEAKIDRRTDWTENLITLRLDLIPPPFVAGQFFNLAQRVGEHLVRRSYSAASAPGQPLEFFISRVAEGELTPPLFDLQKGDTIILDPQALGFFTLAEVPPAKSLWLVATGTGLGPYISMLRDGEVLTRFEHIAVVHGVRTRDHLAYGDELKALSQAHHHLHYIPVLSGPDESIQPGELAGRITGNFSDDAFHEVAKRPFDEDCHMLLCGNPQMITEMSDLLKAAGFEKHRRRQPGHFGFEKYW
jgi:ferredoxin--NADP+ reductase